MLSQLTKKGTAKPATVKSGTVKKTTAPRPKTVKKVAAAKAAPKKKSQNGAAGGLFGSVAGSKPKKAAAAKPRPKPKVKAATVVASKAGTQKLKPRPKAKPGSKKDELAKWYGPNRKLYLPSGLLDPVTDVPKWLDGTLPGDYGFDPLNLSKSKADVQKYREFEIVHARWAMLAVPGCAIPNALGLDTWTTTGYKALDGTLTYTAPPFGTFPILLPLPILAAIQVGLIGYAENAKKEGVGPAGYAPKIGDFDESAWDKVKDKQVSPGGPLNPFGIGNEDPNELAILKVKEIKNGRVAMVAMLGIFVQGFVTGAGPVDNWRDHILDPFGSNLTTIAFGGVSTPTL